MRWTQGSGPSSHHPLQALASNWGRDAAATDPGTATPGAITLLQQAAAGATHANAGPMKSVLLHMQVPECEEGNSSPRLSLCPARRLLRAAHPKVHITTPEHRPSDSALGSAPGAVPELFFSISSWQSAGRTPWLARVDFASSWQSGGRCWHYMRVTALAQATALARQWR